jgi:uncharacterized protein YgiM (DUF1202 family)
MTLQIPTFAEWTGAEALPVYVTADVLNFRSAPALGDNIIATFQRGRNLIAFCTAGDWVLVQPADYNPPHTGYCYGAHLAPLISHATTAT